MELDNRIREFIKEVEAEESRIRGLIEDVMRRAERIREVAREDAKRALLMLEELGSDVNMIKASMAEARGRLRGELVGLRAALVGLEPELRGQMRELLEDAKRSLEEFEERLEDALEDLRDVLSDLRSLAKDVLRSRRRMGVMARVRRGEVVVERGGESVVVSSIRLPREDAEMIDLLVEAGIFKSRSEAVAYFTHRGLEASKDLLERVKSKVEELKKIREELVKEFKRTPSPSELA